MKNENKHFMDIANVVKEQSCCPRRKVGAVFTFNRRIISTGYNQAPSGASHCEDVGCTIIGGHCARAIHAELNGILNAARVGLALLNSTVYCTTRPCYRCTGAMRNSGVLKVYYESEYNISDVENPEYMLRSEYQRFMPVMRLGGSMEQEEEKNEMP